MTSTIALSPNIEWNIWSCKVDIVKQETWRDLLVQYYEVVNTNSCTWKSEVVWETYWVSWIWVLLMFVWFLILLILLFRFIFD
jgi:hypothetical protein